MAKRILVPLDATTEHEAILPVVADAARAAGAAVRLLHVAPPTDRRLGEDGHVVAYADQEAARIRGDWVRRFHAAEGLLAGVPVECEVRFGTPIDEILAEARGWDADLVAVTTTCANSLKRGLLGSVAEQVLRRSPVPVLLLRPSRS